MVSRRFALAPYRERIPHLGRLLGDGIHSLASDAKDHTNEEDLVGKRTTIEAYANWLEKHAAEYRGQWVALRNGAAIDSDVSGLQLKRRLGAQGSLNGILFIHIDS